MQENGNLIAITDPTVTYSSGTYKLYLRAEAGKKADDAKIKVTIQHGGIEIEETLDTIKLVQWDLNRDGTIDLVQSFILYDWIATEEFTVDNPETISIDLVVTGEDASTIALDKVLLAQSKFSTMTVWAQDEYDMRLIQLNTPRGIFDPLDPDTDGDKFRAIDGAIEGSMGYMTDEWELEIGTNPFDIDTDDDGIIDSTDWNPLSADSDGDGLIDPLEDTNLNGIYDIGIDYLDYTNPDTDEDGLPDGDEDTNFNGIVDGKETDPNKGDSNHDWISDGWEVTHRTDPLKKDYFPKHFVNEEEDDIEGRSLEMEMFFYKEILLEVAKALGYDKIEMDIQKDGVDYSIIDILYEHGSDIFNEKIDSRPTQDDLKNDFANLGGTEKLYWRSSYNYIEFDDDALALEGLDKISYGALSTFLNLNDKNWLGGAPSATYDYANDAQSLLQTNPNDYEGYQKLAYALYYLISIGAGPYHTKSWMMASQMAYHDVYEDTYIDTNWDSEDYPSVVRDGAENPKDLSGSSFEEKVKNLVIKLAKDDSEPTFGTINDEMKKSMEDKDESKIKEKTKECLENTGSAVAALLKKGFIIPEMSLPDLTVTAISRDPQDPRLQEHTTITVTVKNIGTEDISNEFFVQVWAVNEGAKNDLLYTDSVSGLTVDSSTEISFDWIPDKIKEFKIMAVVDPTTIDKPKGDVRELDSTNNILIESIDVSGEVFITDGPYAGEPMPDGSGTFSVTITWTTNVLSDSKVSYGSTQAFGNVQYNSNRVISHSLTITGLYRNLVYYYRVFSYSGASFDYRDGYFETGDSENVPPIASIGSITSNCGSNRAAKDSIVTFKGWGFDPDTPGNQVTAFEWKSDIEGGLSDLQEFPKSGFKIGTHTISFRAKDSDNVWSIWVTAKLEVLDACQFFEAPILYSVYATDHSHRFQSWTGIKMEWYMPEETVNLNIKGFKVLRRGSDGSNEAFNVGYRVNWEDWKTSGLPSLTEGITYTYQIQAYTIINILSYPSGSSSYTLLNAPHLQNPDNFEKISTLTPNFKWDISYYWDNEEYGKPSFTVWVYDSKYYTEVLGRRSLVVLDITDTEASSYLYIGPDLESGQQYYWWQVRVEGKNGAAYSQIYAFET